MLGAAKVRKTPLAAILAILACLVANCALGARPALVLDTTVPLPRVSGRIDHMAFDPTRGHIAIAEIGNDSADIVNLETRSVMHRIGKLVEPQGIAYVTSTDSLVIANGGDGSLRLYRGADFSEIGRIDLGGDVDNVHGIEGTDRVLVGYGSGALALVDTRTRKLVSRTPLAGHPEGFRLAPDEVHAYVNVPNAHEIAVVDIATGKQTGTWRFPGLRGNFPMAIDRNGDSIAVVFRSPPRLGLVDTSSGKLRSSYTTCGDADDVFFNESSSRIYVSCGAGEVDVFGRDGAGYRKLQSFKTSSGARTALYVPDLDRLFVAARAGRLFGSAKLFVLRPE